MLKVTAFKPDLIVTGMALGWDQAVAQACINTGVPFVAAIPFEGQELRWQGPAIERYHRLREAAAREHTVSLHPGAKALQDRNKWMVREADQVVALWNGSLGGTRNCVVYAEERSVPVTNLWHQWEAMRPIL
jgi:uncharacterized phage-like protein YoqJ